MSWAILLLKLSGIWETVLEKIEPYLRERFFPYMEKLEPYFEPFCAAVRAGLIVYLFLLLVLMLLMFLFH